MRSWRCAMRSFGRRYAAMAPLLLAVACDQPTAPAPAPPPGEWRAFEGSWSAAGTRQTLNPGPNHRTATFQLTGSLLLTGEQQLGVGFRAQAIGFSDSAAGTMHGRAVWTDERGDQAYSDLKGEAVGTGNRITGTFIGGTGRYAGVTGEYSFQWQFVIEAEDGTVSGRALGLKGRARLAQAEREQRR